MTIPSVRPRGQRPEIARLPDGVSWLAIMGGGLLGKIGFMMALFIAGLALDDSMLDPAKIGILIGSAIGGVGTGPSAREPGAAAEESR